MKPERLTDEELREFASSGSHKLDILAQWMNNQLTCSHCGKCKRRCDVLQGPDLDMGQINEAYAKIMEEPESQRSEALMSLVSENFPLYNALRQCCFCGHCTAACARHIAAPESMRAWRALFMEAGLMPPDDSKLVMVDNEWNIFSAYRAIYGIAYPEFVSLDAAADYGPGWVDTLFFPGCSLVSYAPDVMRAVGAWLSDSGVNWALSDGCCGSPLMSAGMFERAHDLRQGFIDQMKRAGITRMITVCPGCADEFRPDLDGQIELVPLPEVLLELSQQRIEEGGSSGFAPMPMDSVTFFDSCHDRDDVRNAQAIRKLFALYLPEARQAELDHSKRGTLCCGAGGAVGSYDAAITDQRVWRVIGEAKATGAEQLITMCPTCTYTIAQAYLSNPEAGMQNLHYLEALFGVKIDWAQVFAELAGMWTGEYALWLNETFFS